MRFEDSVEIHSAPEDVWAVLADVERWPEWTASMQKVERREGRELTLGTEVRIKQPRFPAVTWTVTELDPGRAFTWAASKGGVTTVAEHRLDAGTRDPSAVGVSLALRQSGPLAGVLGAMTARLTRRYLRMEAEGLKRRCEAPAPS